MAQLDPDPLLQEVSPDAPCGPDLSYDPEYLEMERRATATPERQVGSSVLEAQEPDWAGLSEICRKLLTRSKDLRIAMLLALAELKINGIEGLCGGLKVINGLVTKYWAQVHPQLDPSDGNDPVQRINILSSLSPAGAYGDTMQFKRYLREAPLCRSKMLGTFSLRDIMIANGAMPPPTPDAPKPDPNVIEAAFRDIPTEQLQGLFNCVQESTQTVESITTALQQQVGDGKAPHFDEFRAILEEVLKQLEGQLVKRGAMSASATSSSGAAADGGNGQAAGSGEIRSTQDVVAALERICDYYARYEPSSPIPLLLRRAQRLVSKNFLEIIKDLTPASIQQIEMISGTESAPPPTST